MGIQEEKQYRVNRIAAGLHKDRFQIYRRGSTKFPITLEKKVINKNNQ